MVRELESMAAWLFLTSTIDLGELRVCSSYALRVYFQYTTYRSVPNTNVKIFAATLAEAHTNSANSRFWTVEV